MRLAHLAAQMMPQVLELIASGTARTVPQDESQATYAPRLRKEDGLIPWHRDAQYICRFVRAMQPWPGAFTFLDRTGKQKQATVRVLITGAQPYHGQISPPQDAAPGTLMTQAGGNPLVLTGKDLVEIRRLKPAGKKEMTGADFVNGYRIRTGMSFSACR
jgi:methionyl-tRNA formyltransferase